VAQCQTCHAPLTEQLPRTGGADNPVYVESLRDDALSCAGCHVRAWTRYGPPKPDGSGPVDGAPHAGFVAREDFRDPAFCSPCHDFKPSQKALDGKLLQETGPEWARTDFAAKGTSCQDCHMPEGRHLWKGVHDPEMVKKALTVEWKPEPGAATLTVANTGAGHRLPTYTTPQLTLTVEQLDATGALVPGTRQQRAIARYLKPNLTEEYFDTRLLPGESISLVYTQPLAPSAASLHAMVECWPDEAYRRFYELKLAKKELVGEGRRLLAEALQNTLKSRFRVWEIGLPVGGAPEPPATDPPKPGPPPDDGPSPNPPPPLKRPATLPGDAP
jgi:hypothetical protein